MLSLEEVSVEKRSFAPYRKFNKGHFASVTSRARGLRGKRIVHISATSVGGGVAEILQSQVALEQGLGLDTKWFVIQGPSEFFKITKKIHNLLQGKSGILTSQEKNLYISESSRISSGLPEFFENLRPDLLIIHDPQPAALVNSFPAPTPSILRLHIDLSVPNVSALEFLRPFIEKYSRVIISRKDYRPLWLPLKKTLVITPTIDPFTPKNQKMSTRKAREILMNYGVNPDCPIISQVSRFDAWKDPLGVIEAFYRAKNELPHLQLILAGFFQAADDPESVEIFKRVQRYAKGDPDIFLFENPRLLKDISIDLFVNAIQSASDVVLQKSLREGFGLTVTEAMWKGKPVIGGMSAGIALQIKNGKNGFLVRSPSEAAGHIVTLIKDRKLHIKIGNEAAKSVAKNFLIPRSLKEHFEIYSQLI